MQLNGCQARGSAVVSLNEPHKFMSVSDELCTSLIFPHNQIHGHSIKILQGPKTDIALLGVALKAAQIRQHCAVPLTIYRRDGSECDIFFSCCAHVGENGEVDGLSMDFLPHSIPTKRTEHIRAESHELAMYANGARTCDVDAFLADLLEGIEVE